MDGYFDVLDIPGWPPLCQNDHGNDRDRQYKRTQQPPESIPIAAQPSLDADGCSAQCRQTAEKGNHQRQQPSIPAPENFNWGKRYPEKDCRHEGGE